MFKIAEQEKASQANAHKQDQCLLNLYVSFLEGRWSGEERMDTVTHEGHDSKGCRAVCKTNQPVEKVLAELRGKEMSVTAQPFNEEKKHRQNNYHMSHTILKYV